MTHEKIDTDQVVNYLTHAFEKTYQHVSNSINTKPTRKAEPTGKIPDGNLLYNYQVEFCYMIDEIQRGPQYIIPKVISDANNLISQLEKEGQNNKGEG